jgi:hypothetical protein
MRCAVHFLSTSIFPSYSLFHPRYRRQCIASFSYLHLSLLIYRRRSPYGCDFFRSIIKIAVSILTCDGRAHIHSPQRPPLLTAPRCSFFAGFYSIYISIAHCDHYLYPTAQRTKHRHRSPRRPHATVTSPPPDIVHRLPRHQSFSQPTSLVRIVLDCRARSTIDLSLIPALLLSSAVSLFAPSCHLFCPIICGPYRYISHTYT